MLATLLACASLAGWGYLALGHHQFWKPLLPDDAPSPDRWPSVDIIVPARNEADTLPNTLPLLLAQDYPGAWRVLLVDDHSRDGTTETAHTIAAQRKVCDRLTVLAAPDLPQGWSGKVAAMQAGVAHSNADFVLFTDADISHSQDSLRSLVARAVARKLDLTSLMVRLHCHSVAEKLLIPAFVFFFAMLYPFRAIGRQDSAIAGAAGGVMLVRRAMLDQSGGLTAIKGALIDDCALAKSIKKQGGRVELTLTHNVRSTREYPAIKDVWHMIARTAYTQLNHAPALLAGTVVGMSVLFLIPVLFPLTGWPMAAEAAFAAWLLMAALYLPMILFYDLPVVWSLTLPVAAAIYIAATVDSARLYHLGKGGQWKGRAQA